MPSLPPLGRDFLERLPDRFVRLLEQWREILRRIPEFREGNGSPEGVVAAPRGTRYLRLDGGPGDRIYVKTTPAGNTGWEAL